MTAPATPAPADGAPGERVSVSAAALDRLRDLALSYASIPAGTDDLDAGCDLASAVAFLGDTAAPLPAPSASAGVGAETLAEWRETAELLRGIAPVAGYADAAVMRLAADALTAACDALSTAAAPVRPSRGAVDAAVEALAMRPDVPECAVALDYDGWYVSRSASNGHPTPTAAFLAAARALAPDAAPEGEAGAAFVDILAALVSAATNGDIDGEGFDAALLAAHAAAVTAARNDGWHAGLDEGRAQGRARLLDALNWALGCGGDFRERRPGEGPLYWRRELADRAGLRYDPDAKRYVAAAAARLVALATGAQAGEGAGGS